MNNHSKVLILCKEDWEVPEYRASDLILRGYGIADDHGDGIGFGFGSGSGYAQGYYGYGSGHGSCRELLTTKRQ